MKSEHTAAIIMTLITVAGGIITALINKDDSVNPKQPETVEHTQPPIKPVKKKPAEPIPKVIHKTNTLNDISTDNDRNIISVSEGQIFELCGYNSFSAQTGPLVDANQTIKVFSSDRSIPKAYRSFQGYSNVVPVDQRTELWPGCNAKFSFEYLSGKKRIIASY